MDGPGTKHQALRTTIAAISIAAAALTLARAQTPITGALARIADAGRIRLGYRVDASPFSYRDDSVGPAGYSIALCQRVANAIKEEMRIPKLDVEWLPVTASNRFEAVRQSTIDMLCGADTISISRRKIVDFSIPIFPGGIGVLLRADAPARLKNVLSGKSQPAHPIWRASASEVLEFKTFAVVASTTSEAWVRDRIRDLKIVATATSVPTYDAGLNAVLQHKADALFAERAILLDLARRRSDLVVLDRAFSHEALAFALPRGDEAFRLVVDGSLAQLYAYGPFNSLYAKWFGEPDEQTLNFFRWSAIPD
jgi:ABC-type amino acid transport substrate-binding protein